MTRRARGWRRGRSDGSRKRWFRPDNLPEQLRLIIHEIGHQFGGHLDAAYYNGLARIGAALALAAPEAILKG